MNCRTVMLDDLWILFENKIFKIPSSDGLFNQYRDSNTDVDLYNAAEIRRKNLYNYFKSFDNLPLVVVIGEAPGPWECRFSGIPFTGERQLLMHELPFHGERSSKDNPSIKVRKFRPYVSNSARIFWRVMKQYHPKFFVWNCVPIHPYKNANTLSVRTPSTKEVIKYSKILAEIIYLLNPEKIVALGRKAEFSLIKLDFKYIYVRHPSQGGAEMFKRGIGAVFSNMYHK